MASSTDTKPTDETQCNSLEALLDQLPKERFWESIDMYQWHGFWFTPEILKATMALPLEFEPRDDDVLLASSLKVGTTWLKALCLSIMHLRPNANANGNGDQEDILSNGSPHIQVPTIESMLCVDNPYAILAEMPSPRLLHTHLPFSLLLSLIKKSKCKIVYITRNPKDTFISLWHHMNRLVEGIHMEKPISLEKAFECFCNGAFLQGPFFEHALEYYKESLELPQKVLFLKYEELKSDPKGQLQRIASFLGRPFASEEQVDQVLWNCNFERMKKLQANTEGRNPYNSLPNDIFFRRGVIGDSKNYLTAEMEERLDQITCMKLKGTDLDLNA